MRPKSILIPAYDFKPLLGGVANYVHELAVQFSRQGPVHVLSRTLEGAGQFDRDLPYRVSRIRTPKSGVLSTPLFGRSIRDLIGAQPPDAVFCPMWLPDGAAARWALRGTSIPYFVAAHGTEVFKSHATLKHRVRTVLVRNLKGNVFRDAAKVFPVSNYTRSAVLEEACGDPRRVVTVNNGVNPELFRQVSVSPSMAQRARPHGERVLLTVTRLYPYKGVDRMLESLPAISRVVPGIRYLIVGEGPDRARLEALSASLGLGAQVDFLGRLELAEIVQLYNAADLFVMLSREEPPDVEGFGLVFLEAAACGLPSVGGRSGGIPDAIEEGRSGWLVDPRDTRQIAALIVDLLTTPGKLEAAAAHCLASAPQKNWERVAERILQEMFGT